MARRAAIGLFALALAVPGCRGNMVEQPRFDPYEENDFFPDRMSARRLVPGTVPRGQVWTDEATVAGTVDGQLVQRNPLAISTDLLRAGEERYNVYCAPCHSRTGDGTGMIVRRGFRRPPPLFEPRLEQAPDGHFFDVITNGFGAMPRYDYLVPVRDRWAIVAYIRALQVMRAEALGDPTSPAARRTEQ